VGPGDDPGAEAEEPEVPGAAGEPGFGPVAGAVAPADPAGGTGALIPARGEVPGPREPAPGLFAATPGPALPRAPAPGA
jgi:hypothetical protein